MTQDASSFFEDHIDAIRGLEGRQLERALSQLLKAFQGHIWGWANKACRDHGDREFAYVEDVFNVISLELSVEVRKMLLPGSDTHIKNYWAYFRTISQRESFAFFHSGETTGFSNGGGAARRVSKINKTRKELSIANGVEPTDEQVVEEVNRLAVLTRVNPKKQGALVTLDDLKTTSFSSLDGLTDEFGDSIWATEEPENSPLTRVELPALIASIIDACYDVSDLLGDVSRAWIGDALAEEGAVRTDREVATQVTLRLGEAAQLIEDCKAVAVAVCAEKYGIDSPFA
jgi:hypothetical protein